MKGTIFIITYFCWQDSSRIQYSLVATSVYSESDWTIQEVNSIAEENVGEDGIDGYYITKQEILSSNI